MYLIMTNDHEFANIIKESLLNQCFIHIWYFDGMNNHELTGLATMIDQQLRSVKISHTEGMEWISLDDILHIRFQSDGTRS
ncbi:hypothetical protein ASG85_22180 [Paenibacillus sp. Soil724D2]|nr:hypothetical protein ASG85_22180 [Paenibacillus sp. Soil724D2]